MTLRKAFVTTFEDWARRDREMNRLVWLAGTLLIVPALPLVFLYRLCYVEPEKLS